MKWISVKDKKPKNMIVALVCNCKGWMVRSIATYHADYDVWVLADMNYHDTVTLDVTHYIEIPPWPRE
jgi:hypothetical protein